jgi:hypothetical protein
MYFCLFNRNKKEKIEVLDDHYSYTISDIKIRWSKRKRSIGDGSYCYQSKYKIIRKVIH